MWSSLIPTLTASGSWRLGSRLSPDKYVTKVSGKYNLINWDYQCPKCDRMIDECIDMREKPDGYNIDDHVVLCPDDGERMHRIWRRAPTVFIGGDQSDRRIALMKKS